MSKISDKLNIIKNAKESIKSSIEAKGVSVGDVSIEEYSSKIDELKTTNIVITDARYLFAYGARTEQLNELLSLCKDLINTSNMFVSNSQITEVPYFDTSKSTNMNQMFNNCTKVVTIPELDASSTENVNLMFTNNYALKNFGGFKNLGKAYKTTITNWGSYTLDTSVAGNMTAESILNIINNLYDLNLTYDVANGGTLYAQTLKLKNTQLNRLTEEQIAIATSKGWNITV